MKTKEGLAVHALNNTKKATTISLAQRQRGMSFIGLCMLAAIIVFLGYVGFKSVPVVTEYAAVQRALKKASEGGTVLEVRQLFDRQANIDYLEQYANPISSKDLIVSKKNDAVVVEVEYDREIPLVGPAFLVYKLHASSH
ncbi:DUF4845 domain-containing protein [Vandammella animalimorsus]|uniref:DUF4845 domain-containing protein n=1 Tax=Vandammella animalimorsus TaxID=2029117 RepID=UPI001EEEC22F|nr:DUF4845 domain-containing protein [Vandammella animalimorsus]